MRRDPGAELNRKHLGAEANAEEGPLLAQGDRDPVDLATDVIVRIVGAHRSAKNNGTGMVVESLGQWIAEARPADIERMAERAQRVADAAGTRCFLMQD